MMHADTYTARYLCMHSLGELLYPQTYNEYWSVNEEFEFNYDEPAVNDALTKFIALLTKMYTAN